MQVSVESTGNIGRKMTVQVPAEGIEKNLDSRLRELSKNIRMKGFRPGKIPMGVLKKQYGERIRAELTGELIEKSFYDAIKQENINPVGMPAIDEAKEEDGQFTYIASFDVMPEITLAPLDGVEFEIVEAEVTDTDLDEMMQTLRQQRASWTAVERAAQEGDRVTIDYVGTIDGEEFSGNRGSNMQVVLGGKRMIAGFEEGITGATAGSELKLDLSFPEDYPHKEVAGKPVSFAITVHSIEEQELPEMNEEFVKQFGIEDGSIEKLQQDVRSNMKRELTARIRSMKKQQVLDKLLELHAFEVPKELVNRESSNLLEQMKQNMQQPKGKSIDLSPSMFEEEATKRVTLGLLISEMIKRNELKASAEKVDARLAEMAESYEDPTEVIGWYKSDKKRLAELEAVILEDEVIDWVLSNAQINTKNSNFKDVMGR